MEEHTITAYTEPCRADANQWRFIEVRRMGWRRRPVLVLLCHGCGRAFYRTVRDIEPKRQGRVGGVARLIADLVAPGRRG